jgi:AraC-like DNA-binding protein
MLHNFDRKFERNHDYETEYIKILYYDLQANHKEIYKSYQYNRLCTIVQGTKHVKINNGNEFDYSTSDFILIPPNSSVDMEIKDPTIAVVYEISDKLIDDTRKKIELNYDVDNINLSSIVKKNNLDDIQNPIQRIHDICMGKDVNRAFLVDLYAQELVYDLMKRQYLIPNTITNQDPTAYTISRIMDNLYNSHFTIKEVAAELNISPSTLINSFRKNTGYTPKEYQNLVKLKASVHKLKEKSVTDVCYDLGFENISYFIKIFKSYYGETPKQYMLRLQNANL